MNPFWRKDPLEPKEEELLAAVQTAHHDSCFRQNPSFVAIQCAATGSLDLYKSIAAALMTFGGPHGPIPETYDILFKIVPAQQIVDEHIWNRKKVPGWGMSFVKGEIDPIWVPVYDILMRDWPTLAARINQITAALHVRERIVYPNPSAFSAAAALVLCMPRELSPLILIAGRIEAWAEIYLNTVRKGS